MAGPKREPPPEVYADIVRTQREAQPFVYPSDLIEFPMRRISDVNTFRSHFWNRPHFLKANQMSVQWAIETASVIDFLASCLVVEDPKFEAITLICKLVNNAVDRAASVDLDSIAARLQKGQLRTEMRRSAGI